MSVMIIGSQNHLNKVLDCLNGLKIDNIYFYNANSGSLFTPTINGLLPFVDVVVLGKEATSMCGFSNIFDNAIARKIPLIAEDCIHQIRNLEIH